MNKIDMSLGWFTLGSSGDVQITSLNVGKGVLYTERNSRRVGINVGDPPPSLLATLQIGNPIGVLPQDVLNEGAMSMLIVADKGYRPTSFNQVGGGTLGFSNTLDSTIWVNTNDVVPPGQGTGISFGGRTPHGHFPFARMTGFRADDVIDRGGFSLEVLDTLPIDPDQYGELSGKPVLFERMRITGDGKVGFGGVSDPEFGVEIREDLGCNGIFNGGYERYEPTSYNVSGSTITDLNAVNIFGNLSQQTDTWYYSFENKSQTPSRNTCVRFDDNANVYTAAVVDVGFSETDAGIFREGESLIIPNLNSDVSIIPYKASLLFKTNPQGDPLWTVRFISYTNTFGVNPSLETILTNRQVSISEISTSRNENSVPGAERYDVYVQGITTGNVLDIFTIEDGNWKFVTQIIFSDWGTNNTFVARFESVFTGTSETGVVIKEFLAVEGSTIFPIGLDTVVPQTFIRESIITGSRTAFAVTSFKPVPGRDVTLKYSKGPFTSNGTALTVDYRSIISFYTSVIPPSQYVVSVFRIGGTGGDYLFNTNFSSFYMTTNQFNIVHFGITNPRAPLSQEGVVRIGRDVSKYSVFLTVPVKAGSISYKSNGDSVRTLTTLAHDGSIIIKTSDNFNFNQIDYFTRLVQNPAANSVCITRSIDVDRGTDGNGENSCSYIAGSFQNNFDLTRFTVSGANVVNTGPTFTLETGGGLEERSAFLLKLTSTGNPSWVTVIDGDNMDEGISVAVQDDVFQDQSGEYNVYLSGTFKGDGDDSYTAEIYDSSNDPVNPLKIESFASVIISQSEIGGTGGHEESFVAKFNYDGKYIFNYKATGTGDVSIKYIDVGPDGNLAMCGLKKTPLMRLQEPDGSISRYVPREDFECGFLVKFRTAGMLILPTPSGDNIINTYKKTIINTSGYPLYVAVYKPNSIAKSIPNVSVVPGRKSMDFVYDGDIWVPEASEKLTTDLLFLDRDNGRFGFGTTFPRATVDVRGNIEVSGSATIGRDLKVRGGVTVGGNVVVDGSIDVISQSLNPFTINGNKLIPLGTIVMWTSMDVPPGWALCDGNHNTPDLRGRFVIGYNPTPVTVPNGGIIDYNPLGLPYNVPEFPLNSYSGENLHKLTVAEMPRHEHAIPYRGSGNNFSANNNNGGSSNIRQFPDASQISDGTGDITSGVGEDESHNNMPPYYVLAFIMKV